MQQGSIDFPDPPAFHAHDPVTSREALGVHEDSGARARHQRLVLALVGRFPHQTAIELWHLAAPGEQAALKEPQEVRRRLCDLEHKGLVAKGPPRACRHKGTRQVVWHLLTQHGD